jgi:transcriptional regulator with XRE-family HTH domain
MRYGNAGKDFALSLAAELKWQLTSDRLKGSALARGFGLTQSSVSNWLNGISPVPLSFAFAACDSMGSEFPDLLALAEKRSTEDSTLLITGDLGHMHSRAPLALDSYERGEMFVDFLAAELKSQIRGRGFSLRQMSKRTDHSPSLIGIWLNGKRPIPTHFAYNACNTIGVSIVDLAKRAERQMSKREMTDPFHSGQQTNISSIADELVPENSRDHYTQDSVFDFSQVASDRGVLKLAARGDLTPEALREIADVIERHIPRQDQ